MSENLTVESVKKLVPKTHRSFITQELVDKLNNISTDKEITEAFKDNFVSYLGVFSTGKYKMEDYLNAVKYISYKLLGYTNVKAYAATFPDRYERLVREEQNIDSFVSMYNRNKLVMQIYEQTMVPSYVLNAPLHQEAINELAKMIKDSNVKGMTKVKACEAILQYTKQPDVVKGELTISVDQQNTIAELREVTEQLADTYRKAIESKQMKLKEVAESNIVDVEYEEV